ncbi:MAG: hypothetical protein ACLS9T_08160 [Streptococcus salivarius]
MLLLAILVLLGIVMPDGYQVRSEQLREVISDKLATGFTLITGHVNRSTLWLFPG